MKSNLKGTMPNRTDDRWARALQAKGISTVRDAGKHNAHSSCNSNKVAYSAAQKKVNNKATRAMPFKATGHKGGISRQNG